MGVDDIDVQYCPTEQMLADFFTKLLQGNLFRKLRDVILGRKHIDTLRQTPLPLSPPKERVGERPLSTKKDLNLGGTNARSKDRKQRLPTIGEQMATKATYADKARQHSPREESNLLSTSGEWRLVCRKARE